MSLPVWVNGQPCTQISVADRGLAYGDGIFETMRVENHRAIFLNAHFTRLFSSADFFGIAANAPDIRSGFALFLAACPAACVVKIVLTRGTGGRGYLPDANAAPTVIFSAHELPAYPPAFERAGIHATVLSARLGTQPLLAGHKHLNRLEQVLLRRELATTPAAEALVCDANGRVVEGVFHNVFAVQGRALFTPTIHHAGVRGVMREQIRHHAEKIGVAVQERECTINNFLNADAIFFCNSVSGIWPVNALSFFCQEEKLAQEKTHEEKTPAEKTIKNFNAQHPLIVQLQHFWQAELSA